MIEKIFLIIAMILFLIYLFQEILLNHRFTKHEYYYYRKYKNLKNKNKRYRRIIKKFKGEQI